MSNIHQSQKESLIKEFEAISLDLKEIIELGNSSDSKNSALSSTLKSITGGKLKADFHQLFIFGNNYIYIQPYSGVTVLPGEHHIILNGTFPSALILANTAIFGSNSWKCPNNKDLAKKIQNETPGLKNIAKKTEFEWAIGMGKIELEWAFQLYNLTNEKSHFIMQSGRYGGFTTYKVGFSHFKNAASVINNILSSNNNTTLPEYKSPYIQMAITTILGDSFVEKKSENIEVEIERNFSDYSTAITNLLTPNNSIFVRNIPDKKLKNIHKKIVPEKYREKEIIAFYDTSAFGSGKEGIVFGEETCHINDAGKTTSFDYTDIINIGSVTGKLIKELEIQLKARKVLIPLVDEPEDLINLFKAISQINKLK